ncbi:MAG: GcrA family cell cycle regulator [Pseudorhizobium pelagicum]|uniref:GcrA family cell cycle regulator n=1 Tax=Pseudorhizobium pelagicum TaxID=1509405 RepID=UPI00345F9FF5
MNEGRPWDEKDIEVAAEMWKAGSSASAIAGRVKRSRNAVCGLMNRDRDRFPKRGKGAATSRAASAAGSAKRSTRLNSFNVPVLRRARAAALAAPKAVSATAPEPAAAPELVAPVWAEGHERGAKADLSRFRLADVEPKSFASLGRFECRFPLVCFEAPSGPDMACCGAGTDPLKSYCDAHLAVMAGRV